MKQCKLRFAISANFIDEVEVDVALLHVFSVVFGSPFRYMRDANFKRRRSQYPLVKDGKSFIINAHKGKYKTSLVNAHQTKRLIDLRKKCVLIFLRQNQKIC
jgi:hypothetical protein